MCCWVTHATALVMSAEQFMGLQGELFQVKYNKQEFFCMCVCVPTSVSSISCFKEFKNFWKCLLRMKS